MNWILRENFVSVVNASQIKDERTTNLLLQVLCDLLKDENNEEISQNVNLLLIYFIFIYIY